MDYVSLNGYLEIRKRGVYRRALINRGDCVIGVSMDRELTMTPGQKLLVMWDFLVVNGTRQSLMFLFKRSLLKIL